MRIIKKRTSHKPQDVCIMIFLCQKQTVVIKGGQYFSIESCEYFDRPGRLKTTKLKEDKFDQTNYRLPS